MARKIYNTTTIPGYDPRVGYQPESYVSLGGPSAAVNPGMFSGIRSWFRKRFNPIGSNKPLFKGDVNLPSFKGIREQSLFEGGPSVGGLARTGMGLYQGGKALKGIYENANAESSLTSLKNDINTAIASNPMYDMYMDAADEKTLRQMQNGNLTDSWGGAAEGTIKGIPQALLAALIGGVAGGPWGAAINGIGSLGNSAISGYGNKIEETSGKLQGLYDRLRQANSDYKAMKRPTGLGRAGLQTQYFNQMY